MATKTQKQLIAEINERTYKMDVALFGLKDTEDMGLYGIVKDACKDIKRIDACSRRNSTWISAFKWATGVFITIVLVWMSKLQGWWG